MIKIRISYNHEQELEKILKLLAPATTSAKVKKSKNGHLKKIYITIKDGLT